MINYTQAARQMGMAGEHLGAAEQTVEKDWMRWKKGRECCWRMRMRSFPNKRILETIHETPACVKGITIEYYIF